MRHWTLFPLLLGLHIQIDSVFAGCVLGRCWPSVDTQSSASESSSPSRPSSSSLSLRQSSGSLVSAGYPLEWRRLVQSNAWSGVDSSPRTQKRILTSEWENMMYNLSPRRYFEKIRYAIRKEYEKLASDRPFHLMDQKDFGCDFLSQKECATEIGIYMEGVQYAKRAGYMITRAIFAGNDDTLDLTKHESPTILSDYYYYVVICGSKSKNKMMLRINAFYDPQNHGAGKNNPDDGTIYCDGSPRNFLYATGRPKLGISSLKLKRGGWNSKAAVYVLVAYVPMRPRISSSTYPTFSSTDVSAQPEPRTIAEHVAVTAVLRFSSQVLGPTRPGLFARRTMSQAEFTARRSRFPGPSYAELLEHAGQISGDLMRTMKGITNGYTFFYDVETTRREQSGVHTTSIYRIHAAEKDRKLRVYWTCQATVPDVASRMMMVVGFDAMGHNDGVGEQQHGPSMYLQIEDPRSGWTACDGTSSGSRATVQFAEWRVGTSIASISKLFKGVREKLKNSYAEEFRSNFWNDYWIGFQAVTSKGPAASLRIAVQLTEQKSAELNRESRWDSSGYLVKDMEDCFDMDSVPVLRNGRVIHDGGGYLFRQREWELANSLANFYDTHLLYGRDSQKLEVMEKYEVPGAYQSSWQNSRQLIAPPMTFGDGTVDVYGKRVHSNEEGPVSSMNYVDEDADVAGNEGMDVHAEQDAPRSDLQPGSSSIPRRGTKSEEHLRDVGEQELDHGHERSVSMTMNSGDGKQVFRAEDDAATAAVADERDESTRSPFDAHTPAFGRPVPILQLPDLKGRRGRREGSTSQSGEKPMQDQSDIEGGPIEKEINLQEGPSDPVSPKHGWRESWRKMWRSPSPFQDLNTKAQVATVSKSEGSSPSVPIPQRGRAKSWWQMNPLGKKESNDKGSSVLNLEGSGPPSVRSPIHERTFSWSVPETFSSHSSDESG